MSFRKPGVLTQAAAFARWCRLHRILVVHSTGLPSNVFALPAAASGRVPVRIGNRREINPDKTPLEIGMQRAAYACAHRIVANSRAAATRLMRERVPAGKIAIVPNGLDLGAVRRSRRCRASPTRGGRRESAPGEGPRRADRGCGSRLAPLSRRTIRDRRRGTGAAEARGPSRRPACVGMPSRFSATARTWPPGWRRPTSSCCLRDRRRFRTRCSRRWRPACRLSRRAWAASVELVEEGQTGMLVPPDDPGRLADRLSALMAEPSPWRTARHGGSRARPGALLVRPHGGSV